MIPRSQSRTSVSRPVITESHPVTPGTCSRILCDWCVTGSQLIIQQSLQRLHEVLDSSLWGFGQFAESHEHFFQAWMMMMMTMMMMLMMTRSQRIAGRRRRGWQSLPNHRSQHLMMMVMIMIMMIKMMIMWGIAGNRSPTTVRNTSPNSIAPRTQLQSHPVIFSFLFLLHCDYIKFFFSRLIIPLTWMIFVRD